MTDLFLLLQAEDQMVSASLFQAYIISSSNTHVLHSATENYRIVPSVSALHKSANTLLEHSNLAQKLVGLVSSWHCGQHAQQ